MGEEKKNTSRKDESEDNKVPEECLEIMDQSDMDADIMSEIDTAENEIDVTTTGNNGFNTAENVPDEDVTPANISAGNESVPMDGCQNNILEDITSRLLNGQ